MRVLGISGSLRRDSYNRHLLRAAEALLPPEVELVVFEALKAIPPFDEDDEADAPCRRCAAGATRSPTPMRSCSRPPSTTTRSPAS